MASPREEAAVAREELIEQKKNEKKSQTTLAVKQNIVLEARESPLALHRDSCTPLSHKAKNKNY